MNAFRRLTALITAVFLGASFACGAPPGQATPVESCPICNGKLSKVGSVTDDRAKPSKNLSVWNRSICANPFYNGDSLICTQCWLARSKLSQRWERSSEQPVSFRRPLSADIRDFPVPSAENIKSLVVYSQRIAGAQVSESVAFWCSDSADLITGFRAYARKHHLAIRADTKDRTAKQICVSVETKPSGP